MIIKEPWERKLDAHFKRNISPYSMDSENTDMLVLGYQEDGQNKTSYAYDKVHGHEEIRELREEDLCSVSHTPDNVNSHPQKNMKKYFSCSLLSKTDNYASREHLSVLPRRPFAPKSAADLKIGDLVKFSRPGGKISKGTVLYKGPLPGREEVYLGVELEGDLGKHDGVFQGTRYFLCKSSKGVFVNFSKVIMAWS
ncbi:CAP-Gly domain-containing linker protein 1-like [Pyxicephalus adspersus]|uniref:CAP-Gly domain-containing linker protein 1-like n=1 Tax=Pyxicephalus adspersus TaxID=30357 RepID=UPI003B58CC5D